MGKCFINCNRLYKYNIQHIILWIQNWLKTILGDRNQKFCGVESADQNPFISSWHFTHHFGADSSNLFPALTFFFQNSDESFPAGCSICTLKWMWWVQQISSPPSFPFWPMSSRLAPLFSFHPDLKPVLFAFSFAFHYKAAKFDPQNTCAMHFFLSIPTALPWLRPMASGAADPEEVVPGLPASSPNPPRWGFLVCSHRLQTTWPALEGTKLSILSRVLLHSPMFRSNRKMHQQTWSVCASNP